MLEKHPKSLKLVFKHYPLSGIHKFAVNAAIAAMAAGKQGKFWEFHDALFTNHSRLNEEKVQEIATQLGLDPTRFETDRGDSEVADLVNRDYREGSQLGIRGVPTVYINGKQQRRWSPQSLEQAVEAELQKKN